MQNFVRAGQRSYVDYCTEGGRNLGMRLHYNVLSGLSVKQEIKGLTTNYVTMHYPGRKPVYLSSLVLRLVSFASS